MFHSNLQLHSNNRESNHKEVYLKMEHKVNKNYLNSNNFYFSHAYAIMQIILYLTFIDKLVN